MRKDGQPCGRMDSATEVETVPQNTPSYAFICAEVYTVPPTIFAEKYMFFSDFSLLYLMINHDTSFDKLYQYNIMSNSI